jgi:hypothetical protein
VLWLCIVFRRLLRCADCRILPSQAAATAGGLCFFHANPNKAAELGRIGGRNNRHVVGGTLDALPTLDNAIAVRDAVAWLIAYVYAGMIHRRIAAGLAPLLNLQLRAIETANAVDPTNLEKRVAELTKLVAELKARVDPAASTPTFEIGLTLVEKLWRKWRFGKPR